MENNDNFITLQNNKYREIISDYNCFEDWCDCWNDKETIDSYTYDFPEFSFRHNYTICYVVNNGEKYGIIANSHKLGEYYKDIVILPFDNRKIGKYVYNGNVITYNENNKCYGIFNIPLGKFVLKENNPNIKISYFNSTCFMLERQGKVGLLNTKTLKTSIPVEYRNIKLRNEYYFNGSDRVTNYIYELEDFNKKKGFVLEYQSVGYHYDYVDDFCESYPITEFISIPCIFDELIYFYLYAGTTIESRKEFTESAYVKFAINNKVGLLNIIDKKLVFPPIFDSIIVPYIDNNGVNGHWWFGIEEELDENKIVGIIGDKHYSYLNGKLYEISPAENINIPSLDSLIDGKHLKENFASSQETINRPKKLTKKLKDDELPF